MAIQQGLTTSFKLEMLQAQQNLSSDVLKMALFTAGANLGANTTGYATANEVVGAGYTAGGNVVTGVTINANNGIVYVSFDNVSWPGANFVARGALIYNDTQGGKSVAVLDFGADKSFTVNTNTVALPPNTASTAIIRFP